jgi:hypothetical protein
MNDAVAATWQKTHNTAVQMTNAARRSANNCRNFEQKQGIL